MKKINCPICGEGVDRKIIYSENLPVIEQADYSARKNPDNYHYQMVRCTDCGLLFADSIYEVDKLHELYSESDFSYGQELKNLKRTYGNCLKGIDRLVPSKQKLLEIGCGNGFLMEQALDFGYAEVVGVELSQSAIAQANSRVKDKIIKAAFNPDDFEPNSFDVVFFAMVIEHMDDLDGFMQGIYKVLKPGGIVLGITHDERSFLSKVLKDKCPIINDEHVFVFSKTTLKKIFNKHNYIVKQISDLKNIYSLRYWLTMLPLPSGLRRVILKTISILALDRASLGIKAGNIFAVAQKPISVQIDGQLEQDMDKVGKYKQIAKELRKMIIDISFRNNGHHIGSALSCLDILTGLYFHAMKIDPNNLQDPKRDWFVLSKGHAALAQYVVLAKRGFFPEEALQEFLVNGSLLGAHPDKDCVPGVEVSTGSLGHGLSIACGVALAAKKDKNPRRAFAVLGDGECQEGSVWEAIMFAGYHKLDNLIAVIDYNNLQAFGKVDDVLDLDSLSRKFESFNWKACEIDGHDMDQIIKVLDKLPFEKGKPSVIIAKTIKGKGASLMENKLESHYMGLNQEQRDEIIKELSI